ncbi:MAG: hypothetical protein IPJ17_01310 [Holophagales bacterium]|nr:MAG: hypothetical protein IPJ17_01310 [Holophagales bacterium]
MNPRRPTATSTSLLRAALLLALASASAGRADDRGLISASTIKPYVFVLLDTSGSMNWTPSCTQAEYDTINPETGLRTCDYVCPAGDCAPPRYADDPASKFRQAKESLYEVMQSIDDEKADFGFGSFDQDNLDIRWKHWLYKVQNPDPTSARGPIAVGSGAAAFVWPPPADPSKRLFGDTFGRTFFEGGLNPTSSFGGTKNSNCDTGNAGDNEVGCYARNPADILITSPTAAVADPYWELQRVLRFPKLGATNTQTVFFYVRANKSDSDVYWIQYAPAASQTIGNPTVDVVVSIAKCTNISNNCDDALERGEVTTKTVRFERVGDFIMWTYGLYRNWNDVNSTSSDYFPASTNYNQSSSADNTCDGLELNTDRDSDRDTNCSLTTPATGSQYYPCNIKHPTIQDPAGRDTTTTKYFDIGDRIPADWDETRSLTLKQEILRRLAPSLSLGEADPTLNNGFGQARYLTDLPVSPENLLRVKNPNIAGRPLDASFGARPLIANGSTPLGGILRGFSQWYCGADLQSANCSTTEGWSIKASQGDDFWGCRSKFIIMLTDGDDTCSGSGNPCTMAARLQSIAGIRTYVIGFGVPSATGNSLSCIARNGGTTDPYNPRNKQELIRALQDIFNEILERTSTFASAAVPTVQATVADKVFVSNFTPVKEAPIWAGSLYAFLKPLPLGPTGSPEITVHCSASIRSKCFLFDAGDVQVAPTYSPAGLLLQTPDATEVAGGNLRIGSAADQRRVFYRYGPVNTFTLDASASRRWFRYPDAADELDFWTGMGIDPVKFPTAVAKRAEANTAVRYALVEKTGDVTDPSTHVTHTLTYVLGDIFHSDPVVVDSPRDSRLYREDPYSTTNAPSLCSVAPAVDPARTVSPSYRSFVTRHACRRKMLLVGANDGEFHAFDVGTWQPTLCDFNSESVGFSDGTGREIFAFIPRAALPDVYDFKPDTSVTPAVNKEQRWTVDGRTRVADVFIDPRHTGTPTCLEREWRTVAVGSMREGGRSYFALDLTQPDTYTVNGSSYKPDNGVDNYVPTCLDGGAACGNMPFPAVLWEFADTWNEDNAGPATTHGADLGNTWSPATIGRIRVCTSGCGTAAARSEDRWVMVVGGGLGEDPTEVAGNWIYMIDIETGVTLYKRQLQGAAPAPAAAVDTNQDGYLDTVYLGTTAGLLYKVDLGLPSNPLPLTSQTVRDYSTPNAAAGTAYTDRTVTRIATTRAKPFVIFSTGGRPIYMETTVIYVAKLGQYALAFGTGNRWDLWDDSGQVAQFFTILDTGFVDIAESSGAGNGVADPCASGSCATTGYRTAADYLAIDPDAAYAANTPEYLLQAPSGYQAGWYLTLRANEKVITDPFAFAGVLSFTSYDPETQPTDTGTCIRTGTSRVFVVKTTNADPYVFPNPANASVRRRYWEIGDFTTQPFVEQSATKNPATGSDFRQTSDQLCTAAAMVTMREELKKLYPGDCKFNNMTLDVKTIRSDTGMACIAPVPECVAERHWKEY